MNLFDKTELCRRKWVLNSCFTATGPHLRNLSSRLRSNYFLIKSAFLLDLTKECDQQDILNIYQVSINLHHLN